VSDLIKTALDAAAPSLEQTFQAAAGRYLEETRESLGDSFEAVKLLVSAHLEKAAAYKAKALTLDGEARAAYEDGVRDELRSAKTVMVSEVAAVTAEQAASFAAGFGAVLAAVGSTAKGLLTALVSGLASGAIKGLAGGAGDLSSILPGASS